jgi:hypothetical protein
MLAFVHIPRTGGGTVKAAIMEGYSRPKSPGNFQVDPESTRLGVERIGADPVRWKAVADHIPLGLYRRYLPADTRYITFLRDPIDRVLSHYHFLAVKSDEYRIERARRHGRLTRIQRVISDLVELDRLERERGTNGSPAPTVPEGDEPRDLSLKEAMASRVCIFDNFATRFLCGRRSLFGELPPDALERAKENVAHLWLIGITERLDDSIVLLGRKLGVGLMPYDRRHVNTKRPSFDHTSDEDRELIARHNRLDLELYAFARDQFEKTAPSPDKLADDVRELRRLSVGATEAGEAERRARRSEPRHGEAEGAGGEPALQQGRGHKRRRRDETSGGGQARKPRAAARDLQLGLSAIEERLAAVQTLLRQHEEQLARALERLEAVERRVGRDDVYKDVP